jgi:hypothetical protein
LYLHRIRRRVERDPRPYPDPALTPPAEPAAAPHREPASLTGAAA